jgi:hypothetical protein
MSATSKNKFFVSLTATCIHYPLSQTVKQYFFTKIVENFFIFPK